jgi:hypothetical protein
VRQSEAPRENIQPRLGRAFLNCHSQGWGGTWTCRPPSGWL